MTGTPVQNGTITAHGRTWPLYEHEGYHVEVLGTVDAPSREDAETIASELHSALDKHGVSVRVESIAVIEMSPEDQAEKNALDEASIQH